MNKKSKIIIAILIFIFLGLIIFAFAAPSDEGEDLDNRVKQGEVDKKPSKKTDDKTEEDEKNGKENENTNVNVVTDDSLDKAKEAVAKAEKDLTQEAIDAAKKAIEEVTDGVGKSELEEQLADVQAFVDARSLVEAAEKELTQDAIDEAQEAIDAVKELDTTELEERLADVQAYVDAEALVEAAEKALTQDAIDEAQEAIDAVKELDTTELQERLDAVQADVDAKALVEELAKLVEEATSREDIEEAIEFNTTEEVEKAVANVNNEELKTELTEALEEILAILNDETPATVNGITDGQITNDEKIIIDVKDKNEVTITLSKDDEKATTIENGAEVTEEGTYTLTVVDAAFNVTEITFTIDRTPANVTKVIVSNAQKGLTISQGYTNNGTIVVRFTTGEELNGNPIVKVKKGDTTVDAEATLVKGYTNTYNAKVKVEDLADGRVEFTIANIVDKAGNVSEDVVNPNTNGSWIIVDKTKATINIANDSYNTENVELEITEEYLDYVYVYINHSTEPVKYTTKNVTLTEEGTYKINIFDKAGNKAEYWTHIDLHDPEISEVSEYTNAESVSITVSDRYLKSVKINDTEYTRNDFSADGHNENYVFTTTLKEEGTYTIVATDKAGHTVEKTFTIDRTAPVYNSLRVVGGKGIWENSVYNQYVTNGSTFYVYVDFEEKLGTNPVLTINGTEIGTMGYFGISDGKHLYNTKITLSDAYAFADGLLDIRVSGYADVTGNIGTALTMAENGTLGSQKNIVVDRTAPVYNSLRVVGGNGISEGKVYNQYVTNGSTFYVYVDFEEKLGTNPVLTINGTEIGTMGYFGISDGKHLYNTKITLSDAYAFADGLLDIRVSGYADSLGNVGRELVMATDGTLGSQKNIVVDRTLPVINVENKVYNQAFTATITDTNFKNATLNSTEYTTNEINISVDDDYTLVATDKAGNSASVDFKLDATKPKVTANVSEKDDDGKVTVTITGDEALIVDPAAEFTAIDDTNKVFTKVYTKNTDAPVTVVVTDLAGNAPLTPVTYNVDKFVVVDETKPVVSDITFTKDKGKGSITFKVVEENLAKVEYKFAPNVNDNTGNNNWREYTVTPEVDGEYEISIDNIGDVGGPAHKLFIRVTDKKGNSTTTEGTPATEVNP